MSAMPHFGMVNGGPHEYACGPDGKRLPQERCYHITKDGKLYRWGDWDYFYLERMQAFRKMMELRKRYKRIFDLHAKIANR